MTHLEFMIDGMSCGSCVARIEKALKKLGGVESVRVELASGKASVEVAAQGPTPQAIVGAITAAGYESRPISASKPA